MWLVSAPEKLERKEAPVGPGELPECGEIVQARVVERERFGRERLAPIADLRAQVEHALLDSVDRQLAAVYTDPAAAQLLGDSEGGARASEGVEDDVTGPRR